MTIAEGVSARVARKAYASGVIQSNTQAMSASDLGASGAQIMRRVSVSWKLGKDTYQSNEIRSDHQIADFRHGMKRAQGSLSGEFSPGTYWDEFEAVLRGTDAAPVSIGNADLTSLAADASTSKLTAASGDPVALGLKVGDILTATNLSDSDNNGKNFVAIAFGGTSNREITVYPPPDTMGADTSFTLAQAGRTLYMPSSGFVSRKFGLEVYSEDISLARLFTECRLGGFNIALPATGMATVEFPMMGRDMEIYSGTDAPFFTSPTAESTSGIFAAVNGALFVDGTRIGVVTGLTINATTNPSSDPVVGQNYGPEIFLGRLNVTGSMSVMLQDDAFLQYFNNETEFGILAYLTTTSAMGSPAATIFLPRVKLTDSDIATSGEGAQIITAPFQALKYVGAGAGIIGSIIRLVDTAAV